MQSLKSGCFHHFQNQASEGCTMHMITTPAFGCGPKSGRCCFLDPGIRIYWQDPSLHKPPSLSLPLSAAAPRTTTKKTSPTAAASHPLTQMSRCTTPVAMDSIEEDFVLVDKVEIEGLSATPHPQPLLPGP